MDEEKLPVLFVSDNGVGLNEGRMNAMLSDGIPNKKNDKATGSHGNGHFTTFNLSGLRYLLYGGVSKEDNKLMSGHAILGTHEGKTHEGKKSTCGKDGYFVTKVTHELYDPFIYPREDRDIPSVVLDKLRTIEDKHGTGALLAVLDFNYLGEKYSGGGGKRSNKDVTNSSEDVANLILCAAARNFFVAVQRGELVVTIRAGETEWKLDAGTIQKVIDEISPGISSTRNFPGHKVASRFYRLFTDSNNTERGAGIHKIKTDIGTCEVRYRQSEVTATKIALCRNGMWITEAIPSVKSQDFASENVAFEALLLCDATDSPRDLSYLIRMAEGNLHNELQMNGIANQEDKKDLRKALQKIREELKKLIDKQNEKDNWFVGVGSDGLIRTAPDNEKIGRVKPFGGGSGKGPKGSTRTKGGKKTNKNPSPRPGKGLQVRCIAVRNNDTMKIRAMILASSPDIELRLNLSGGGDFSCDSPTADNQRIRISSAKCNNKSCPVEGDVARIGAVEEGDVKEIFVEFIKPEIQGDYKVNCEFIRRGATPATSPVS